VQSGRRSAGRRGGQGSGLAVPEARRSKRFRVLVIAAAVILATGLGFGVGRVIGLGNTVILTAIPKPATGQDAFTEDDDGIAQDNQENVLQATAPGMVHILSGGTSVGIGSKESSYHVPGQVHDTAVGTTGRRDVGASGSGLNIVGYAIPINTALAVATRIADGDS
jgi:hypothetical protein